LNGANFNLAMNSADKIETIGVIFNLAMLKGLQKSL
jgi:hypothetical protein